MKLANLPTGKYIVAVSGGVDSVVLLDLLSESDRQLVVVHFDHGIRSDSSQDAKFVRNLATQYGLEFELGQAKLGSDASEDLSRQARYQFLNETKKKHQASHIITAHHSDDIVETMVINLIRGTGWRGLSSLRSTEGILRPLLKYSKSDILDYARTKKLTWVEDSTNQDPKYLRNLVRNKILSGLGSSQKQQFLELYQSQLQLRDQIDSHTARLISDRRHDFIMWPRSVALEVLRSQLQLTRPQAHRALMAIKTAKPGTKLEIADGKSLEFTHKNILVMVK